MKTTKKTYMVKFKGKVVSSPDDKYPETVLYASYVYILNNFQKK
jgi:hypothetical protein